jgi:hypothetical protein
MSSGGAADADSSSASPETAAIMNATTASIELSVAYEAPRFARIRSEQTDAQATPGPDRVGGRRHTELNGTGVAQYLSSWGQPCPGKEEFFPDRE